jgi:hypothetical protein
MAQALFLLFVGVSAAYALQNWRGAWPLALLCGVLQDPARKLTPGQPVYMTFTVVIVYAAILIAAHRELQSNMAEFARRFADIARHTIIFIALLLLAAANALFNYGITNWQIPALGLFTYLLPIPAVIFAYTYIRREETLFAFFRFYAMLTSVMLLGSLFEYLRLDVPALGQVSRAGDYIRHLTGLQIRLVSGFYRAPDIMGWHAAVLTSICFAMAVRAGFGRRAWPWFLGVGWGFFNVMISGRRKAIYFVVVFAAVFIWRYFRRMRAVQVVGLIAASLVLALVVRYISAGEQSSIYTRGAGTTQAELVRRLEGGFMETLRQSGIMGAGLGTATQGVRHVIGGRSGDIGWQEGGLGKLAVELGLPGVLAAAILIIAAIRKFLILTRIGDVAGSSQLPRVTLFALTVAIASNFVASAQAYSDPVLAILTAFVVGALFATATLDERLVAEAPARVPAALPATA